MVSIRTSTCNVRSDVSLHFLEKFSAGDPGAFFAHISMTTWARDFKFAGAVVQRLHW